MTNCQITDVLLFCSPRPGVDQAALEAVLGAAADGESEAELVMIMPANALPALEHTAEADAALPAAILTLRGSVERVATVVRALEPGVDLARSSLLAVQRHSILPGKNDAVRLFFGLRRLDRLTLEAFHDYWLNHHAKIARRLLPPYSYHQLHANVEATAALAAAANMSASTLDGVAEVYFPDIDAFVALLSSPEITEVGLVDERKFIDHARSLFWAYRTHEPDATLTERSGSLEENRS